MWITTREFESLKPIYVFHKQLDKKEIEPSAYCNVHTHFIKDFDATTDKSYTISISADDYYKLYVNGKFVCQGPAPAYLSNYKYNQADITPYIKDGVNRIAVHVYYQGKINRVWNSGDNRMGLWAKIHENNTLAFETDESWLYKYAEEFSGETTGYETQYLENINFAKKDLTWKTTGKFGFTSAIRVPKPDWQFSESPTTPLSVYNVKPAQITQIGTATYLLDFGTEITGQLYFKAQGKSGQKVIIKHAEELNEDGTIRYDMRCNCKYYEECTLSGGEDEFEFFDYKAFRYAQVECESDVFVPYSFMAIVRHAPFSQHIRIKTDIPQLAQIWEICKNGVKIGAQEGFLDCPSREKGQYLGDFTISGLSHLYLTGNAEMYKKTLFDFADSACICDGIMAVAPGSFMQEIADFSLQYPLQLLHYYNATEDIETVRALYPTVDGILAYFARFERADGLLENAVEKWNLVDWPKNLRDGYTADPTLPLHNVINAFYICANQCTEKLAALLSIDRAKKSETLTAAYINTFYDAETKLFYDDEAKSHAALHSNVLPLCFGIAPTEAQDTIHKLILQKKLSCGVQFSFFVLKALTKIGAWEDAFLLILNESEHGWVNMLREGATTCFEAWGKEQKWNTSLCHPWASAPIIILLEDVLDIPPAEIFSGKGVHEKEVAQGKITVELQ